MFRTEVLMIVARGDTRLFDYLRDAFADEPTVEVFYDRRRGERRQRHDTPPIERRQGDRRRHQVDHLMAHGWVVVRREARGDTPAD